MADRPNLAQAMFPNLPEDRRALERQQFAQDRRRAARNQLLENLREINRRADERLAREPRR
jgi:hypothetical protein